MKIIKVESCLKCPYMVKPDFYRPPRCMVSVRFSSRDGCDIELEEGENIPPWCPLEEMGTRNENL